MGTADGRLGILPLYPIRIDPFSNRKKKMGEGTLADCGGRHTASAAGALATVLILGIARRLVACIIWVSDIGSRSPSLRLLPDLCEERNKGGERKSNPRFVTNRDILAPPRLMANSLEFLEVYGTSRRKEGEKDENRVCGASLAVS